MTGFSPAAAARERAVEAAAIAAPSPERAGVHSRTLSERTHVAGTPQQAVTRDYVLDRMREWGLQTETRSYTVWMPHATEVRVWRVSPDAKELDTAEPPIPGDSTSALAQYPPANGSSAAGDVRGEVVYVNYGLISDYARLDSLGVSVRGKVAIARYGRSFRGIKAREAERHGAVGLIIYSDPADDGYAQGDVYPEGPMRPEHGLQRGSVFNGDGDPSTPGYASTRGAKRIPQASMEVPHIPVVALSYGNAAELLRGVRGKDAPAGWQGGLPFRYHVGAGPVQARIAVKTDSATAAYKEIWNTYGTIRGSELPDQVVVIGAHRDAWGPGAADNVSGVTSVLEAARAVAEAARAGNRPRRTIVFATWDAEEWGLVGSTEYVEEDSARLRNGAVAYFNQDVTANGPRFTGGGAPSLRALLRDVARAVPSPEGEGTVYSAWRRTAGVAADSAEPSMGDPGGGSDFAGFYNHLGIPISEWGFGGSGGVYHSQYDAQGWMTKFGDPGYKRQTASARIGAAMVLRMANAEVLPYDYVEFARTLRRYLPGLDSAMTARGWGAGSAPVRGALDRMERAAVTWAGVRDGALAAGLRRDHRERANRALLGVERALTRPSGLKNRPWFRNLIYAADVDNGYSTMVFPGVGEAVRGGDRRQAELELGDLAARIT
ncbi:MAG TPA: M20/M25/M40 family metallo-hydrolase, partial [Longimicrobiaceae bacterium]|nr:M20/M25/M40 family metallo-hydrolase [Longimicrobiaceae bacterium]